ncbi:hypothetical protein QTP86_007297 [Hemibagrus guttatus]|nr:hypothetical protein QTP86_007297 [Hemibagrus guttatus]
MTLAHIVACPIALMTDSLFGWAEILYMKERGLTFIPTPDTWLSDRVLDAAIQLDRLTAFHADRNAALCEGLCELYGAISELQNAHPDRLFIIAGDFNHANLKSVLPKFHKHVDCSTRGTRLMIDLVVVSSDLRPHVLDTRMKSWAELSTDHHRVGVFNFQKSFNQIPREVGDIESEWTMFSSSVVEAAIQSCGHKVSGAGRGGNPQAQWWTLELRDAVKLKESHQAWLAQGTPEAVEAYRQAK